MRQRDINISPRVVSIEEITRFVSFLVVVQSWQPRVSRMYYNRLITTKHFHDIFGRCKTTNSAHKRAIDYADEHTSLIMRERCKSYIIILYIDIVPMVDLSCLLFFTRIHNNNKKIILIKPQQ